MFIAILTYKKPLSEVDKHLATHREYLATHYATGNFIASSTQTPRIGGVIMMKAENRATVDSIISQDPFYANAITYIRLWGLLRQCVKMKNLRNNKGWDK